jgi:hypothetical protein
VVRAIKVLIPALLILGVSATPSRANHVSITADASAILIERAGSNSWKVKVSWAAVCQGAGGAFFSGNLSLVDMASGESIYLGGISSASGEVFQLVAAKVVNRQLRPEMKINCGDNGTLHGSPTITVFGGSVVIPRSLAATVRAVGRSAAAAREVVPAQVTRPSRCRTAAASP